MADRLCYITWLVAFVMVALWLTTTMRNMSSDHLFTDFYVGGGVANRIHGRMVAPADITAASPRSPLFAYDPPRFNRARGAFVPSDGAVRITWRKPVRTIRSEPATGAQKADLLRSVVQELEQSRNSGLIMSRKLKDLAKHQGWASIARSPQSDVDLQNEVVRLCTVLTEATETFSAADISHLMDALVELGTREPQFRTFMAGKGRETLNAISSRASQEEVASKFTGRQASQLIWAFSKMGIRNENLVEVLGQRLMTEDVLNQLNAHDISMTVWGLAKVRCKNIALLDSLAESVASGEAVEAFGAQSLVNVAWGFAKLGIRNEVLIPPLHFHPCFPSYHFRTLRALMPAELSAVSSNVV